MSNAELFKEMEGTFDVDPKTIHHFSDGLYAKQMVIPKGFIAGQHKHHYSHLSILAKGHVIVRTDESAIEYIAPTCIEIKAEIFHTIEALEDSAWFCIHATEATNEKDTDKIDAVLISRKE